jgi:hypothetical protein
VNVVASLVVVTALFGVGVDPGLRRIRFLAVW